MNPSAKDFTVDCSKTTVTVQVKNSSVTHQPGLCRPFVAGSDHSGVQCLFTEKLQGFLSHASML